MTDWSDIPLEIGGNVDWLAGYRVYSSQDATSPLAKGYADDLVLTVKYLGARSLAAAGLALSLVTLV